MPWGVAAAIGGAVIGGYASNKAAGKAADAQTQSAQMGIDETARQFDKVQELLSPYMEAGKRGLTQYEMLTGTYGDATQAARMRELEQGAEFKGLTRQGENAILANASATGGLRGGNVQRALYDSRSNLFSALMERQLNRYAGMAQQGQNSAAGVGSAALTTGQNVSALMQQQGAARAGGALAGGNAIANAAGTIGGILGGAGGGTGSGFSGMQAGFSQTGVGSSGFGTGLAYGNQDMGAYF